MRDRRTAPPIGKWIVRYRSILGIMPGGEKIVETVAESFETKQQARDRLFTVRQFKTTCFVSLRAPDGNLWFSDHFFDGG